MKLYVIALTLVSTSAYAQFIGSEQIDETNLRPWSAKSITEYEGVYHFGDSEWESTLSLIIVGDKVYGQIRRGRFSKDGLNWVREYENIKDIRIEGHKFVSEKANGEFVYYDGANGEISGLKITNPWGGYLDPGEYEVGTKSGTLQNYLSGDYIEASLKLLTREYLRTLTKSELRLMRNEIYARYGFRFTPGGEIDVHFRQKEWYQAQHVNVDSCLTDLETSNIILIRQVEGL